MKLVRSYPRRARSRHDGMMVLTALALALLLPEAVSGDPSPAPPSTPPPLPPDSSMELIDLSSAGLSGSGSAKFRGVVYFNNNVYFVPNQSDDIGVLDATTHAFSKIDISSIEDGNKKYWGGAACNQKIIMAPCKTEKIAVLLANGGENHHTLSSVNMETALGPSSSEWALLSGSNCYYSNAVEYGGNVYFGPASGE